MSFQFTEDEVAVIRSFETRETALDLSHYIVGTFSTAYEVIFGLISVNGPFNK
jgi:hypothetical protein